MYTTKTSLLLVTLVAGVALVQAAGGIKGQQRLAESQQRVQAIKGPRQQQQQQQYQSLPPPPPPQVVIAQAPQQAPVKGPGQVAPLFTAARIQPVLAPAPIQVPIVQQQQQIIQQQEQEPEPSQQQQQEAEVDPSAAAQDSAPALAAPAGAEPAIAAPVAVAGSEEEANPRPEPYAFNYAYDAGDSATSGSSQREETQDANGRVTGFYTLRGEDGRDRRVDYVADANGFRATISTNEMGTAPKDSADVDWQAQAPSDAQLRVADSATQLARQRAAANPIQQQQPIASSSSLSKISSPRQVAAASSIKGQQQQIVQLQEPFEQIRQTELNTRARKSRHAPFYLFTV